MTAKLFYRLIDAAAEKVYRTATVLGPAVGGAVFGQRKKTEEGKQEGYWDNYHSAPYHVRPDGSRHYYD